MQAGRAAITGVANCAMLRDTMDFTYLVPEGDLIKGAESSQVSPYFNLHFALPIRKSKMLDNAAISIAAIGKIKEEHFEEENAFEAAKSAYEDSVDMLGKLQTSFDRLDKKLDDARDRIRTAANEPERAVARETYELLQKEVAAEKPLLRTSIFAAEDEVARLRDVFRIARSKWSIYDGRITSYEKIASSSLVLYKLEEGVAKDAYDLSFKTLTAHEAKSVGYASVGFTLWDKEVEEMNKVLADRPTWGSRYGNPGWTVAKAIPIFDVKMAQPNSIAETIIVDGANSGVAANGPARLEVKLGEGVAPKMSSSLDASPELFKSESGKSIKFPVAKYSNDSAGSFYANITQGGYCMGTNKLESLQDKIPTPNGNTDLIVYRYRERPANAVAVQAAALNYSYYVKADPVSVHCTLNAKRFMTFTRNSGTRTSWFKKTRWDDTTRNELRENGVSCETTDTPTWIDPSVQAEYLDAIKTQYTQDLMAEQILTLASSWQISAMPPSGPASEKSRFFSQTGAAMQALCGGNSYCQIGGIVWKDLNQIFGSSAGESSTRDEFEANIKRDFTLNTWRPGIGGAVIDLSVQI